MGTEAALTWTEEHEDLRRRVYLRHGGYCMYCGRVLRLHEVRVDRESVDAPGASLQEDSLGCACPDCHSARGERSRAEYRAHRRLLQAHQMLHALKRG